MDDFKDLGSSIGPYRLIREIGHGGFGTVYLAEQLEPIRRNVALKLIKRKQGGSSEVVTPLPEDTIGRFETERQVLALLAHPNIAQVFHAGSAPNGEPYFAMEYVAGGEPITEFCDANELAIESRLSLFIEVCDAVSHAHAKAILHRDLKPGNVLAFMRDGKPVVKVIDFGVAKALAQRLTTRDVGTDFHGAIGTRVYMSPEQARGVGDLGWPADVYSLGLVLYELMVGVLPFRNPRFDPGGAEWPSEAELRPSLRAASLDSDRFARIAKQRGTTPVALVRRLRGDLDHILLKSMHRDRGVRYDCVKALSDDICCYVDNRPLLSRCDSDAYLAKKLLARHPYIASAICASLLTLVVVAGLLVRSLSHQRVLALASGNQLQAEVHRLKDEKDADTTAVDFFIERVLGRMTPDEIRDPAVREHIFTYILLPASEEAEKAFEGRPQMVASVQVGFSRLFSIQGRDAHALPLAERALALLRQRWGDHDVRIADSLNDVAYLRQALGKAKQAEPLFRDAYELRLKAYGPDDQRTVSSHSNYAGCLLALGSWKQAEVELREILQQCIRLHGAKAPETLSATSNLASALSRLGSPEAKSLARSAYDGYRSIEGPDKEITIRAEFGLVQCMDWPTERAEALVLCNDTLGRAQRLLGDDHPFTMNVENSHAVLLMDGDAGEQNDGLKALDDLWQRARRVLGDDHEFTLATLQLRAASLDKMGRPKEALPLITDALTRRRRLYGDDHPVTIVTSGIFAHIQLSLGNTEEALRLSHDTLERAIQCPQLGPYHATTLKIVEIEAACLDRLDRSAEATALRAKFVESK